MKLDIHHYQRNLEASIRRLEQSKDLSDNNKELILKFLKRCAAEDLSVSRRMRYCQILKHLGEMLGKDFQDANKDDIEMVVGKVNSKDWSPWTKQFYKVALKKFYRFVRNTDKNPPEVDWFKTGIKKNEKKLPEQLLTQEDILKLIKAANTKRDEAFISLLYESGARISEIALMKIKDLEIQGEWFRIVLHGKTGSRKILIVFSVPYLKGWLSEHPNKENEDAYLWISTTKQNNLVSYPTIKSMLLRVVRKAKIKKPINPHHFRHSRASELAGILTESQLCQYFGWTQGSKMTGTYVHMNGKNLDESIKAMNDLPTKEEYKMNQLRPKICPNFNCNHPNKYDAIYCEKCRTILDIRHAIESRNTMTEEFEALKETVKLLAEKLGETDINLSKDMRIFNRDKFVAVDKINKQKNKQMTWVYEK